MTCHGDVGAMPNSSPNHHGKSLGDMPGSRCFECFDVCCEVPMLSMLFLVPRVLWDDLCYCLRSRVVFEILGFLKGRGRWGISFLEHEPIKELGYTSYFMYFIEQAGIPTVLKANVLTVDTFKQWHTVPSAKKKAAFFLGFCGTHGVSSAKPKSKKRTVDRGMGSLWCIKLPMTCFMIGTPLAPRSAKRQQRHAPKFLRMDTPNNSQICRRARYFFQTIIIGIYVPCTGGLGEPFSNKNPQRKVPNHRVELELVKVSWDQMRHPKEDFFEGFRGFRVGGSYDPQGGPLQNK